MTAAAWGPKVQAWYERHINACVAELRHYVWQGTDRLCYSDSELSFMRAWYVANAHLFCTWVPEAPSDTFYESRDWDDDDEDEDYDGSWRVASKAMRAARDKAHAWAGQAERAAEQRRVLDAEAKRFPALDDWLTALWSPDGPAVECGPPEESAANLLGGDVLRAYAIRAQRIRRSWPRLCRVCGNEFVPPKGIRTDAVRCTKCCAAGRTVASARKKENA